MKVFVLTVTENKQTRPCDVVTSEEAAQAWYKEGKGNDFYPFVVDGTSAPVPPKPKPVFHFPPPPSVAGCDAPAALNKISAYMLDLCSTFEHIETIVNAAINA